MITETLENTISGYSQSRRSRERMLSAVLKMHTPSAEGERIPFIRVSPL
jgi:hypothetical protein